MNKLNQNVTNGQRTSEVFRAPKWIENFGTLTKRKAIIRLFILLSLTVLFLTQIPKLQFDYDFDSFFPQGDEDLAYYDNLNEEFGEFNNFLFTVIKSVDLADSSILKKIHDTTLDLKSWKEILEVQSPFDASKIQVTPFGVNPIKLISPEKGISKEFIDEHHLVGKFFGHDGNSLMFIVRHEAFENNQQSKNFLFKLRSYLSNQGYEDYILSGKVQMQHDFTKKLESELSMLLMLASIFIIVVLALFFRSIKGVMIPVITLLVCIIWTMGFLALTGKAIDVLVVIIPPILLIVSLSDVIHFVHKYDDFVKRKFSKDAALKSTIIFIGKATCLTSITTAIGFLSLYAIPITPIGDFGLYTAIGVAFAFIVTFLLLPSILYFIPKPVERSRPVKTQWKRVFDRLFLSVFKNRVRLVWGISLTCLVLIFGVSYLDMNTSILVGFQKGEPELEEVAYFDNNFGGYKPFEIGIELNNDDLFDSNTLLRLEEIENYAKNEYDVEHLESPLSLIKSLNAGLYGASNKYYKLPKETDLRRLKKLYYSPKLREAREVFEKGSGGLIRMLGRCKDIGSSKTRVLNRELESFLEEKSSDVLKAQLTGTSYLIDKTDSYISQSLVKGLAIAVISVSLFLFAFLRSWRVVLYSLVPNLLPILILFGLMGYFQIDLNISTAIIFTVAFGIAVDDSIHLLARYYIEKERFNSSIWALKNSIASTGKSILVTSIIFCTGFALFLSSGLSSPFYLGFFIVITSVVALILDLILLPVIILGIERSSKARQG